MSNANVSLVQSLYAAFRRGDIATIIAALAPDVVWRVNGRRSDFPLLGTWKGPKEVQDFFKGVAATETFSDFSPREFYAADDKVFAIGHYDLTHNGTGRKVSSDWVHIFAVRGGKVASFTEFNDTAQFAEAHRG